MGSTSSACSVWPSSISAIASWPSRVRRSLTGARPRAAWASSSVSSSTAGRSRWNGTASSRPARSSNDWMAGSRLTSQRMPHTEMFSSRTGSPRLRNSAGSVLGAALKSTSPFTSSVRSWSALCHRRKRTASARPARAPVAAMCING
ncbi:hypothetical protein WJ967_28620 [Achromobacter xylosoxidans]